MPLKSLNNFQKDQDSEDSLYFSKASCAAALEIRKCQWNAPDSIADQTNRDLVYTFW